MKSSTDKTKARMLASINELIEVHGKFQEFLDLTAASNLQLQDTEALIEIRQFNINCISKYTDLVSKEALNLLPLSLKSDFFYEKLNDRNVMWEINNRLSSFSAVYNKVLKEKSLNSITRMIVAQNFEKIIRLRENLLHPISEVGLFVVE